MSKLLKSEPVSTNILKRSVNLSQFLEVFPKEPFQNDYRPSILYHSSHKHKTIQPFPAHQMVSGPLEFSHRSLSNTNLNQCFHLDLQR